MTTNLPWGHMQGEHFVTLSECFVIVRKLLYRLRQSGLATRGSLDTPPWLGHLERVECVGGLLGVTDQELQE